MRLLLKLLFILKTKRKHLLFITMCMIGLTSCIKEYVLSSGEISYTIFGETKMFAGNIQGQFYTDKNIANDDEKYRYLFTGSHFDDCCLIYIRTESFDKDATLFDKESLALSAFTISDSSAKSFGLSGGNYLFDNGHLEIKSLSKNEMKAEFDLVFVEKTAGLDTLHLNNGELVIHDLEHHFGTANF